MKLKLFTSTFILYMLLYGVEAKAQTPIADSIRKVIFSSTNDKQKLSSILDYCDQYQSLNRDTAYDYAILALDMAQKIKDTRSEARAELALANSYYVWGWVDSANLVCDTSLKKYSAANADTRDVYFKLLRQKAICYGGIQKYPESLEVFYKLLREAEQYKDSVTIATTCNSIGSVNINMDKTDEALKWIFRAKSFETENEKFIAAKAATFTNAGLAYMTAGKNDSALFYLNKALPLCRQSQNLNTLAVALRVRSNLYVTLHNYNDAETDLREMISIRRTLNGNGGSGITDDNIQIANFYANTGQLSKAIDFCKQLLKSGDLQHSEDSTSYANHLNVKLEYYKALAGFYKDAGMNTEYTETLEQIINAKDSFYEANSAQAIAEVQTKYETEQKEKTILQQKYDLTKKNFMLYGSIILLLLSGVIFYLLFREYRRKQNIKMEQAMAEEEASKKIAVKEAEEKERKRIAADLHDNLGVQANAILYNTELLKNEKEGSEELVDDLHDTAKQMLLNLRETLWAMKTNDIDAAELWLRVISFSKQMGRHYTAINFITNGNAPEQLQLPSAKALNIVMIIQEAVQNAVKHSNGNEIIINSEGDADNWTIAVTDNGRGFEFKNAFEKMDSHGLKHMQERAAASGLQVEIKSEEASGSSVIVHIPA